MTEPWSYCLKFGEEELKLEEGTATIGRSRQCDLSIADPSVSRRHVDLIVGGGKIGVRDLGSSNGTFVNDKRVLGEVELADGDTLRLGDAELVAVITAPPAETLRIPALAEPGVPAVGPEAVGRDTVRIPALASEPAQAAPPASPHGPATMHLQQASIDIAAQAIGSDVASLAPPLAEPPGPEPTDTPIAGHPLATQEIRPSEAPAPSAPPEPTPEPTAPQRPAPRLDDGLDAFGQPRERGELLPSLDELDAVVGPSVPEVPKAPAAGSETEAETGALAAAPDHPPGIRPAGFWIRLVAVLIDGVWMGALSGIAFRLGGQLVGLVVATAVPLLVTLAGWAVWGTTPGKRLLGLRVFAADGKAGIGFLRAAVRLAGYLISSLVLGIGFLMAGLSSGKLALHDHLAGTWVGRRA